MTVQNITSLGNKWLALIIAHFSWLKFYRSEALLPYNLEKLSMAGFEPRTSGVRSTGSARRAAITDCQLVGLLPGGEFKILSLKEEIWFELRATWIVVTHIKVPKERKEHN